MTYLWVLDSWLGKTRHLKMSPGLFQCFLTLYRSNNLESADLSVMKIMLSCSPSTLHVCFNRLQMKGYVFVLIGYLFTQEVTSSLCQLPLAETSNAANFRQYFLLGKCKQHPAVPYIEYLTYIYIYVCVTISVFFIGGKFLR